MKKKITITPIQVADLLAEGERMPVYVHIIDHPDARVLVDTGMTELHPAAADLDPRLSPLSQQDFDLAGIDIVVNTHLHFDHCGGNHLFAGKPIYVQRLELDEARSQDDYTIREWVDAPGVQYVPVDGELELLPGLRLVPAPGHTRGSQMVVIETGARPIVVGGDVAVWFGELDEPHTEGQLRVRALNPELVWLTHEHEPWRPSVKDYIASLDDEQSIKDCRVLIDLMRRISGHEPKMWNVGTIGFDTYHYKYDSGREGDGHVIGFYPRKGKITVYLMDGTARYSGLLAKLGKHTATGYCLYIKRLSDIELTILEQIVQQSYEYIKSQDGHIHQILWQTEK